jgi:anionic cell wall polymer biosynthesis LytR-Cps2A-Psr (LCP) family protein
MEKISKKRLPIWAWLLILAGVAAVLIAGRYIYVVFLDPASAFGTPEAQLPEVPSADPGETLEPSEQPTPAPLPTLTPEEQLLSEADLEFLKDKINILMLGWDESPERNDEDSELYRDENNNFRSDVLMLLTVDFGENTAKLISIPRDTMAKIYNTEGRWKITRRSLKADPPKATGLNTR